MYRHAFGFSMSRSSKKLNGSGVPTWQIFSQSSMRMLIIVYSFVASIRLRGISSFRSTLMSLSLTLWWRCSIMSGFEIVGVIFGVFPLLVSAAEHYEEGFEPLKKWWRFRTDFIEFIDAIDIEKQAFDLILERFLIAAQVPYEEIQSLMIDPKYEGWLSNDIALAMKARLGPSYDVFMSTIRRMNTLMGELQVILSLKDGKVGKS